MESIAPSSLIPQLVEVTDVGDAADAQVPSHVGRHGQQAVPVQLTVLHLKRKETRPFFTIRKESWHTAFQFYDNMYFDFCVKTLDTDCIYLFWSSCKPPLTSDKCAGP